MKNLARWESPQSVPPKTTTNLENNEMRSRKFVPFPIRGSGYGNSPSLKHLSGEAARKRVGVRWFENSN
jgi:hypothetical protein